MTAWVLGEKRLSGFFVSHFINGFFCRFIHPLTQKISRTNLKIVYPACVYHIIYLSNTADK